MIKKIDVIKNLGVFTNFSWDRDFNNDVKTHFKKVNIIYGRNYSGKTTISRILRSLETKSLPQKFIDPKFSLYFNDGTIISETDIETQQIDIRVFNEDFIFSNLKFLNNPDAEIAPFAILGSDNDIIETAINQLQSELGKNDNDVKTGLYKDLVEASNNYKQISLNAKNKLGALEEKMKDKALDKNHGIKYNAEKFGDINYTVPKLKNDIYSVLSREYVALSQEQIKRKEAIISEQEKIQIPFYTIPILKLEEFCIIAKELSAKEIGKSKKITELLRSVALNEWVAKGMDLHKEKSICSLCGNRITQERREELNAHFDEETKKLESEIIHLISNIEKEIELVNTSLVIDKNSYYSDFHNKIIQLENTFKSKSAAYIESLNNIISQLKNRKESITEPIEFIVPVNATATLLDVYSEHLKLIQECNDYSSKAQINKDKAKKDLRLNEVFVFCKTISWLSAIKEIEDLESEAGSALSLVTSLQAVIQTKEDEIEAKKRQLNDEEEGALQVNRYLNDYFGHRFLELQAETVNDGGRRIRFNIVRGGNIAFNLSEGEKSLVAFCYFIAKLKDITTGDKKPIICIDDPISSLDSNHVFFIYSLLRSEIVETDKFEQLFISTHNLDFFKYLKRLTGRENDKNLQYYLIHRKDESSFISLLPNYLEKQVSEFNYLFNEIYECSQISMIDDSNYKLFYNFGNSARKFLELLLYYLYPDNSKPIDKLEKFFGNGRVPALLTDRINNEYSHMCGVFERGESPVEVPEMLMTAKLIIETIKTNNLEQYNSLLKSIGVTPIEVRGAQ